MTVILNPEVCRTTGFPSLWRIYSTPRGRAIAKARLKKTHPTLNYCNEWLDTKGYGLHLTVDTAPYLKQIQRLERLTGEDLGKVYDQLVQSSIDKGADFDWTTPINKLVYFLGHREVDRVITDTFFPTCGEEEHHSVYGLYANI